MDWAHFSRRTLQLVNRAKGTRGLDKLSATQMPVSGSGPMRKLARKGRTEGDTEQEVLLWWLASPEPKT